MLKLKIRCYFFQTNLFRKLVVVVAFMRSFFEIDHCWTNNNDYLTKICEKKTNFKKPKFDKFNFDYLIEFRKNKSRGLTFLPKTYMY